MTIHTCELPAGALLSRYADGAGYADCYRTRVARFVGHAEYIEAFYTTPLFRVERSILRALASRPSTDEQVRRLAAGKTDSFAAWTVEARAPDQLLLCDFRGRTRSWLMSAPSVPDEDGAVWLYFGSAVVPLTDPRSGGASPGFGFGALLGFHKLYSRALLHSCVARLSRRRDSPPG